MGDKGTNNTQPDLPDLGDVEDLILPDDRVRHAFTGEQLEKRRQLREAIVLLLGAGVPVDTIATRLGVSNHTVMVLRARAAESVADSKKDFSDVCLRTGARWIGLARSKEDTASFKDLMIGAGIVIQKGVELQSVDQRSEKVEPKRGRLEDAGRKIRALLDQAPAAIDIESSDDPQDGGQPGPTVPGSVPLPSPGQADGQGSTRSEAEPCHPTKEGEGGSVPPARPTPTDVSPLAAICTKGDPDNASDALTTKKPAPKNEDDTK